MDIKDYPIRYYLVIPQVTELLGTQLVPSIPQVEPL